MAHNRSQARAKKHSWKRICVFAVALGTFRAKFATAQINSWAIPVDGLWSVNSNWSLGMPMVNQSIVMAQPTNPTITYSSAAGTKTVYQVNSQNPFALTGGQLTLSGGQFNNLFSSFTNGLSVSGGTLILNSGVQCFLN